MKSRFALKAAIIFIISMGLNWVSILLSPYASPDDLGQLAFIMVIFFPAAAFITGILSRIYGLGLVAAVLISALANAAAILIKYNRSGLTLTLIYAAVAIAGYLAAWGAAALRKRLKNKV